MNKNYWIVWIVVLLIGLFLFAGNGDAADVVISELECNEEGTKCSASADITKEYKGILYRLTIETECRISITGTSCVEVYYHWLGTSLDKLVLMKVSRFPPDVETIRGLYLDYTKSLGEGGV